MTPPMTPREKVAPSLSDLLRQAVETMKSWTPEQREAHFEAQKKAWVAAEMAFGDEGTRAVTALASGSGDHAELARLADDLRKFEHHSVGSLKIDMDEVRRIIAVCDAHAALLTENAALRAACSKSNDEISQTLGKALGYPWFKDDQINFPGATAENGVCVGDHVAESLADEAARRLTEAERKLAEAVGHVEQLVDRLHSIRDSSIVLIAARTFLSKEAERGCS